MFCFLLSLAYSLYGIHPSLNSYVRSPVSLCAEKVVGQTVPISPTIWSCIGIGSYWFSEKGGTMEYKQTTFLSKWNLFFCVLFAFFLFFLFPIFHVLTYMHILFPWSLCRTLHSPLNITHEGGRASASWLGIRLNMLLSESLPVWALATLSCPLGQKYAILLFHVEVHFWESCIVAPL